MNISNLKQSNLVKFIFLLCVAAVIILIFYEYYEGIWRIPINYCKYFFQTKRLHTFVSSYGVYAPVVFVLLQALQVVFAPTPGEVTGFIGGLVFGVIWGTLLSTLGLLVGSLLAFGIARAFGITLVKKIVKQEHIDRFNRFTTGRGFTVFFVLFLIPGFPKDSLCYLLGLSSMTMIDFIVINVFARLPGTLILTLQGDAVNHGHYKAFLWLLFLSIGIMGLLYKLRKPLMDRMGRTKRKERAPEDHGGAQDS